MKLKRLAADFQVEELVRPLPAGGSFALYRLTKQSLGTLEAIAAIAKRWQLDRRKIAFAGLKDRHALTTQFVTIADAPRQNLKQTNLELEYLSQVSRPVHASDISGNRFAIVVRDLSAAEAGAAAATLAIIERDGLPNYFDDQRFGSLGKSGDFIARPWCLGDYERTVWLALADENVHDTPQEREEKQVLRENWGQWQLCERVLPRGVRRDMVAHLARTGDFRRAIGLLRQDLRSLWLASFQSHIWNGILAELIQETCGRERLTRVQIGKSDVLFYAELTDAQRSALRKMVLPLPSARLHLPDGPLKALYERVVQQEGLQLREMRVKYPRDSFFSKGERPAVFWPQELTHAIGDDELYPARVKLTLRFVLGRGSYATILIKRLLGAAMDEQPEMGATDLHR